MSHVAMADIIEHPALRIGAIGVESRFQRFLAEGKMVVVAHQAIQLFKKPIRIYIVVSKRTEELAETGKELLRCQAGHLHRVELPVAFNRLQCLRSHPIATTSTTAPTHLDDSRLVHIAKFFVIANELNVRTAKVHGKVLVIHEVTGGRFFQDGG